MSRLPEDFDVSTIEDLDPEPSSGGRFLHLREFFLGSLLLVAVLGWAGWQWWQQTSMQNSYRLGAQAAAAKRWDDAEAYFAAAGGYRDAPSLAQRAAANVEERNKRYYQALLYSSQGKWVDAFGQISATLKIQPDYRDLPQMARVTEGHVYDEALLGDVVQWPGANPPGLYYRAKSGWVWLKGSDLYSEFQFSNQPNRIVYDVPGPGWVPSAARPGQGSTPGEQSKEGRVATLAWLDPSVTSGTLKLAQFPVKLDQYGLALWGREGTWATANVFNTSDRNLTPVYYAMTSMAPLTYVPSDGSAPTTLTLTGALSKPALLTLDSSYDDLLLFADWQIGADKSTAVTVYLADASGARRRTLYSYQGGIVKAQLSSDGKQVLLVTYTSKGDYQPLELSLVLLDATGAQQPVVLAEQPDVPTYDMQVLSGPLQSTYIERGPFAGKVLVTQRTRGSNRVTLLDPASPQTPLSTVTVPGSSTLEWGTLLLGDDRLLLLGYPYGGLSSGPKPSQDREVLISMKLGGGLEVLYIEAPAWLYSMSLRGGYLLFSGDKWKSDRGDSMGYSLSGLPLSSLAHDSVQPRLIYNPTFTLNDRGFYSGPSVSLGENALAYLDGQDLRVRAYDTLTDVKLLSGISALESPSMYDSAVGPR
ncbi:MAG: hypothetical protein IVW55_06940 [Chloroflexi bacterium]|nr:hypothetical protein [Chloroflexota bacterium]